LYGNETELPIALSKWTGYIIQDILELPKLEVNITPAYDTTSRQLSVEVELDFSETVTTSLGISVMILENDIADYQLTKTGKQHDYVHQHVLRTMLTNYAGDAITINQTKAGSTPTFTYTFTLPTNWNADKCEIVAFVSQKGTDLDVLQANRVHLK
jgi:hypothetical protein